MIKKIGKFICSRLGFGVILSVIYGLFIIGLLIPQIWPPIDLNIDGLSKVGGYLSGAFSPIIFLWLIIGYKMQNEELKILNSQAEDQKRKSAPILSIESTHPYMAKIGTNETVSFLLSNIGGEITNLKVIDKKTGAELKTFETKRDNTFFILTTIPVDNKSNGANASINQYERKKIEPNLEFKKVLKEYDDICFRLEELDGDFSLNYQDDHKREMSQDIVFKFSIREESIYVSVTLSPKTEYLE